APPALLQRAWQEPVLRRFLAETPELVQLTSVDDIVDRIQERARALTGADGAIIGLWDAGREKLVFRDPSGGLRFQDPGEWIGGRAFQSQEVRFTSVAEKDAPEHAEEYRTANIHAIVAAPITAEDRRLGVLIVYAARSFVFTDDVVSTTKLVAEQAAMVIHSHQLAREAAEVRALAEVTRLKQDFLSVLAHDVRTPLTTVLINAELLERAIGDDPVSQRRVASLRSEASRLKLLVEEYLEVVQTEEGERELRLARHDLAELVTQAVEAVANGRTRVRVVASEPVAGMYDTARIYQLVQNLVSNALKYSEVDQPVEVRVWAEGDLAHLSVSDRGMGIAEADLPRVFERFHRGSNTDDRRHAGLGLGLYICRLVARDHGGDITVSSRLGEGTTFTVTLKRAEPVEWSAPEPTARAEPAGGMVEPMLDPSPEST
ncbi:MAG TPA: GAF domain-containing sensor histidine kinase, partial [Candidatus Limnocylindria bacterium]|nr:GAF domain-containing sensor histidine kinase [Candidatus Limnocylindria bacterium]